MWNIEGVAHFHRCVGGLEAVKGKTVCEFGDQMVWVHAMAAHKIKHEVGADWFMKQLGAANYVSIDLNGQHGAFPMDLTKPIYVDDAPFDIVTNIGTSEHVEPYELQPMVFENAHNLCKVGGTMVHQLPPVGQWLDHCRIRYRRNLPDILAKDNGYKVLNNELVNLVSLGGHVDYLAFALSKTSDRPFSSLHLMEAIEYV